MVHARARRAVRALFRSEPGRPGRLRPRAAGPLRLRLRLCAASSRTTSSRSPSARRWRSRWCRTSGRTCSTSSTRRTRRSTAGSPSSAASATSNGDFLPTGETLAFILGGHRSRRRALPSSCSFHGDHFFARHGILRAVADGREHSPLKGTLQLSPDWVGRFTTGRVRRPGSEPGFPRALHRDAACPGPTSCCIPARCARCRRSTSGSRHGRDADGRLGHGREAAARLSRAVLRPARARARR